MFQEITFAVDHDDGGWKGFTVSFLLPRVFGRAEGSGWPCLAQLTFTVGYRVPYSSLSPIGNSSSSTDRGPPTNDKADCLQGIDVLKTALFSLFHVMGRPA